jgi:hypothetical protein
MKALRSCMEQLKTRWRMMLEMRYLRELNGGDNCGDAVLISPPIEYGVTGIPTTAMFTFSLGATNFGPPSA